MTTNPLDILRQYWGYPAFRPLQAEIIQSVLDNNDTLALLPTGGGKSLCFQVPALCREGICIVVSPLIALMKDQVYHLRARGIAAEAICSGMHYKDIDRILDNAVYGQLKFLYLSPERLTTDLARERIKRMKVNLLAVDEAHCISQWGYDFRPSYLQIAELREFLPQVPILALTATATKTVVIDIQEKLLFRKNNVLQKSFARPNLTYLVLNEETKETKLIDILKKVPGTSVVYARNRRKTKELALILQKEGISADFYHAGLSNEERSEKQNGWTSGKIRVIVSTNAFGMGIDKPDVRTVIHLHLPDSLEAYFQEAGRAGRDEKRAYAVLLYNKTDKLALEQSYEISFPDMPSLRQIYQALGSYYQLAIGGGMGESFDFDIAEFCQNFKLESLKTLSCLKILEQAGWIAVSEAVFIPSMLHIVVDRETLYDYQLRNKRLDNIIKIILRTYQGIFQQLAPINEYQLAKFLKMTTKDLIQAIHIMHRDGMVQYRPQKDRAQLTFLRERVDARNLEIDQKMYQMRKKRFAYRISKAIAYAETAFCRSQQLLDYFGEEDSSTCGVCDVCIGRTKSDLNNTDFEYFKEKIKQKLSQQPWSIQEILVDFSPNQKNQVLRAITFLVDEGQICREMDKLNWIEHS